jgi:hypothetical protein
MVQKVLSKRLEGLSSHSARIIAVAVVQLRSAAAIRDSVAKSRHLPFAAIAGIGTALAFSVAAERGTGTLQQGNS